MSEFWEAYKATLFSAEMGETMAVLTVAGAFGVGIAMIIVIAVQFGDIVRFFRRKDPLFILFWPLFTISTALFFIYTLPNLKEFAIMFLSKAYAPFRSSNLNANNFFRFMLL